MKNTAKAILTHESRSWRSWEQFSAGHNKNLIMQLVLQQWFTDDCVSPRWRGLWKLQKLLSMETGPNIKKWTAQNLATGWSPVYYVWMFRTTQSGRRKKKSNCMHLTSVCAAVSQRCCEVQKCEKPALALVQRSCNSEPNTLGQVFQCKLLNPQTTDQGLEVFSTALSVHCPGQWQYTKANPFTNNIIQQGNSISWLAAVIAVGSIDVLGSSPLHSSPQ